MAEKEKVMDVFFSAIDVKNVKMKHFHKEDFTALMKDKDTARAEVEKALNSHGIACCTLNKQKQCICMYTFVKDIDPENSKKKRVTKTYEFVAEGYEDKEAEFIEVLRSKVSELMAFTGVESVDWNGEITRVSELEKNDNSGWATGGCFITLGLVCMLCLDITWLGFGFMLMGLGLILSGHDIKIGKKEDKEHSDDSVKG